MVSKTVTVKNVSGLHARPAHEFIATAKKFESRVIVRKDGVDYNGKSMINLLRAGISANTDIEIICEGIDETCALDALIEAVELGLGEK